MRNPATHALGHVLAAVSQFLTQVQQLQAEFDLPLSNGAPGVETHEIILEANYHIKALPWPLPHARPAIYHPTKRRPVCNFKADLIFGTPQERADTHKPEERKMLEQ
jgi:hypothetical protein